VTSALKAAILLAATIPWAVAQPDARRVQPAGAPRRVALAIGNNAYAASPLQNAVHDAESVAAALRGLGFEVQQVSDADLRRTESAVDQFIGALHPGDVGLFYYSGHGIQVDGENYLIPVGFAARDESEVKYQAYAIGRVHDRMASTGARLSLVILDACRDNPFRGARSGAKGWAAMATASGSFIAFATAPNATASDNRNERNGLFTKYLLEDLDQPGVGLSELFDRVRTQVYEASGQRQLPWIASSVIGEFVFHDPAIEEQRLAQTRAEVAKLEAEAKAAEARQAAQQAERAREDLKLKQLDLERQQRAADQRTADEAAKRKQAEEQAKREQERIANEQRLAELRKKLADQGGGSSLDQARQQVAELRRQMEEAPKPILAERDVALAAIPFDPNKGTFETTAEFQERQRKYQEDRAAIESRYATEAAEAAKPYADRIVAITGRTYPAENSKVQLGDYDADRQTLVALVDGAKCFFPVAPQAARSLFDQKDLVRVETTYREQPSDVGDLFLVEPASGARFRAVLRVNPKDGLAYAWIPPGTFTMGCSPEDSECYSDEKPANEVAITRGFWMGQTPVTQQAWQRVTRLSRSYFTGANLPVESVTWDDARNYCQAIGGRLPTEAEWEYAARAGSTGPLYGDLNAVAWYGANSGGKTHEVGQRQPNAFGLYDVLGNVWQWTADWLGHYQPGAQSDPSGPTSGQFRAVRGGSWFNGPPVVRVSVRFGFAPGERDSRTGLRCIIN
jgi:formylglycine-generating enzyme required for sulfatase activity